MTTRQEKYEAYKKRWSNKPIKVVEKEVESMRRYLSRNKDTFFHEAAPDELTDGLRLVALKEILEAAGKA